ncbi:MAG: protein tyrosine phosphatase family protein [Verrucomicrobia bacterium]|nr:protein tyrosine phosphatase family protein [Verrucomicrobiota bacterium]
MDRWDGLLNFRQLEDRIFTSGQPTEAQLPLLAAGGIQTVLNLALPTSPGALPDEAASVTQLGMEYLAIPVPFDAPTVAHWEAVRTALVTRMERKVWVHCALNYRVSAFLAVYRVRELGWGPADAWRDLRTVWEPDPVWTALLTDLGVPSPLRENSP